MEAHAEQDITLVLMDKNIYDLSDGSGKCAAVVGMKDCLKEKGPLVDALTYGGWTSSERREWLNSSFKDAFPSAMKSLFRSVAVKTANLSGVIEAYNDYFSYFAEKEVMGSCINSEASEDVLVWFEWYKTAANRKKTANGRATSYFTRSTGPEVEVVIEKTGNPGGRYFDSDEGISAFCCI